MKNVFKMLEQETMESISSDRLDCIRMGVANRMSTYRYASELVNLYTEPFFTFAGDVLVHSGKALHEYFTTQPSWMALQLRLDKRSEQSIDAAAVLEALKSLLPSSPNLQILVQEPQKLVLALHLSKEDEFRFLSEAESGALTGGLSPAVEHLGYFSSLEEIREESTAIGALALLKADLQELLKNLQLKELFVDLESKLKEKCQLWYEALAIKDNYLRLEARRAGADIPPNLYSEELQSIANSLGAVVQRVAPDQIRS